MIWLREPAAALGVGHHAGRGHARQWRNWGFVAGKTQTFLPWDSWRHPYVRDQPPVWFHEVLRPDGTPYRPAAEVALIRQLTGKQ